MGPISIAHRRFDQNRELMQLDDSEMALSLIDLKDVASTKEARRGAAKPGMSYDAMLEFASAASLILDREEYIAVAQELERALRPRAVAA